MHEVDIAGIGAWSDRFSDWHDFRRGLREGSWSESVAPQPSILPARERRRAPQSVRMAVEVMGQACTAAGIAPANVAVVFASSMGDMEIMDSMCRTLAAQPALVSPTRFHHSVHNAPVGYWSIATQSHAPANAFAAGSCSPALALLEGAIQCVEESVPVLTVCQEGIAPQALQAVCGSKHPLALALLLVPPASHTRALARMSLSPCFESRESGSTPGTLEQSFEGNAAACLLPLFERLANLTYDAAVPDSAERVRLTLSDSAELEIGVTLNTSISTP